MGLTLQLISPQGPQLIQEFANTKYPVIPVQILNIVVQSYWQKHKQAHQAGYWTLSPNFAQIHIF